MRSIIHSLLVSGFLFAITVARAQPYSYSLATTDEKCGAGSADLQVGGLSAADVLSIAWSTGQTGFSSVRNLAAGDHSVYVTITTRHDTLTTTTDTTIVFRIEKVICPVGVPLHFSPNGDGYNDLLHLTYIDRHPNFELQIFNRWGQMVHRQKKTYTPWNGQWNGADLPDGTYYYILIYDSGEKQNLQKGDITILR